MGEKSCLYSTLFVKKQSFEVDLKSQSRQIEVFSILGRLCSSSASNTSLLFFFLLSRTRALPHTGTIFCLHKEKETVLRYKLLLNRR